MGALTGQTHSREWNVVPGVIVFAPPELRSKFANHKGLTMSRQTVGLVVDLTIHAGKFDAFDTVAQEMIAGSRKEPGTLAYEWYLSGDRQSCRLVESYKNADAVLTHFTGPVVQVMVPKLLEVASLTAFEVHGDPGAKATEMPKGLGAQIFLPWLGLEA